MDALIFLLCGAYAAYLAVCFARLATHPAQGALGRGLGLLLAATYVVIAGLLAGTLLLSFIF